MASKQLQKLYKTKSIHLQWMPMLIIKAMGYSSLIAALIRMFMYWYNNKKQSKRLGYNLHLKNKTERLCPLKRVNSSIANLNLSELREREEIIPTSPSSPPTFRWGTGLLSTSAIIHNILKKKKMSISLKNTVLWNPSTDMNTPNHAFYENTISLLIHLSRLYDIYLIIHVISKQEREQIQRLLINANLFHLFKIFYCDSEQTKLNFIQNIQPIIHVEGGWEKDNGKYVVNKLENQVKYIIWITSLSDNINNNNFIELSNHILSTSIAKQVVNV
ncbi:uncharacterized protein BX663DRAFT_503518 [Cokeromyces recurvatus]|uniref:uncharacterized protein n=1 Tax=Cokeromyces recurvatus TaxID=90255 RepID=UPI0022205185|nr:uncharacterized protein BX663DRAFT_503518 [Cokeromyces recurvatus]KAI7904780.1 hypothetical protein BX663DRAFT_503518 [Cokeromyces recurvatus]